MNPTLEYKIKMLPESPGCYIMKSHGEIIYVGKAVNLKNRVRQYFHGSHTPKVAAMVSRVDDFDLMLCDTNFEALTLECNLIKKHKPFYNILLKDDKHYPYLRIDLGERYPRLTLARRMDQRDGAKYFGPYIGATAVRQVMDEVRRFFPLRTCSLSLPLKTPRRPCIQHQIGRCRAPCAGLISEEEYGRMFQSVISFLNGDSRDLLKSLTDEMMQAASRMEYEQAALLRDKIADIKQLMEEQHAIQTRDVEQDILAVARDDQDAMVQLTHIRAGRMEGGRAFLMEHSGDEEPGVILANFITQYYDDEHLIPRNILVETVTDPAELEGWLRERKGGAVTLAVPQRGDKVDLIRLSKKNAEDALLKHRQNASIRDMRTRQAMLELKEVLKLPTLPLRIEGYDISNTMGQQSVAAMVVFENGLPAKKAYRIYRIKTVEGANDFASMHEVITRRLTHGLEERKQRVEQGLDPDGGSFSKFPDVILIDGGPQQVAFAQDAMHAVGMNIPMFGLAEKFEEIYLPDRPDDPIRLDRRSNALHLIQHVRDEAHRFGITHHRALRGKANLKSALSEIEGIGPRKQQALIRHFKSVKAIFEATKEELMQVDGISEVLAQRILDSTK